MKMGKLVAVVAAFVALLVAPAIAATTGYVYAGDEKFAKVTKSGSKYTVKNIRSGDERGYVKPASNGNSAAVYVLSADGVHRKLGKASRTSKTSFKLVLNGDKVGTARKNGKKWDIYEGSKKRGHVTGLNPATSAGAGLLGLIVQIG